MHIVVSVNILLSIRLSLIHDDSSGAFMSAIVLSGSVSFGIMYHFVQKLGEIIMFNVGAEPPIERPRLYSVGSRSNSGSDRTSLTRMQVPYHQ